MDLIDHIRRRRPTRRSAQTLLQQARSAVRRLQKTEKTDTGRPAQTRSGQRIPKSSDRSSRRRRGF